MKITPKDVQKKGFAVLHGKWGDSGKVSTMVGLDGKSVPSISDFRSQISESNQKFSIGYLAYPNASLQNIIPDSRFFGYEKIIKSPSPPKVQDSFSTSGLLQQSVTKSQYIKKIKKVKELLRAGEIYQMCYCIRFRKKFEGNPYSLFLKLSEVNPVDFQAYLNCGDFQIISSSPERFFKVHNGKIITNPIKGTVSKKGGKKNLEYLLNSPKERAELDMITDLERNDIGKICEYGTLKLTKEREVLELKNLWHCYSEVEGRLRADMKPSDVIDAMFPGGSITGCPKKRAMEYISELEGVPRNIFTGAIGYISNGHQIDASSLRSRLQIVTKLAPNSQSGVNLESIWSQSGSNLNMDFNIAIRTILIKDGMLEFWAGGGIVYDSDPEEEYDECMLKAERILKLL